LLPNNTASGTFLHKSVRCEVFTGYLSLGRRSGGDWTNEYVTLDRTFYNLIFKEEVVAAPVTATGGIYLKYNYYTMH